MVAEWQSGSTGAVTHRTAAEVLAVCTGLMKRSAMSTSVNRRDMLYYTKRRRLYYAYTHSAGAAELLG